jgi:hypothetical protein
MVCVALLLSPTIGKADRVSDKAMALLEAQDAWKGYEKILAVQKKGEEKSVRQMIDNIVAQYSPGKEAFLIFEKEIFKMHADYYREFFSKERIMGIMAKYYIDNYTEQELDTLLKFYRSELGKKTIIKSQEFSIKWMKYVNKTNQEFTQKLLNTLIPKVLKSANK